MHPATPFRHFIFFTLLLSACAVHAQDRIELPTTITGKRGTIVRVPVTGSLSAGGVIRVVIEYPADVLRIVRGVGGSGNVFDCGELVVAADTMVQTTVGQISLDCWATSVAADAQLFLLDIEFLTGPGTAGALHIVRMDRNSQPVSNAVLGGSIAVAQGDASNPQPTIGLTGNYPNPFYTSSVFVYMLTEPGPVRLVVRSMQGRTVKDIGVLEGHAGENSYEFIPEVYELAQGPYLMSLEVGSVAYMHPFMILK